MRLRVLAVVRQLDAGRDDAGLAVEDRDLKGYHEKTGWRATLWREPQATHRRRSRARKRVSRAITSTSLDPGVGDIRSNSGVQPRTRTARGLQRDTCTQCERSGTVRSCTV